MARILLLLQLDISALMGYTGAFYREFFGSSQGILFSTGMLVIWIIVPIAIATRIFKRKDL
jgi:Cu-processing system permease protein